MQLIPAIDLRDGKCVRLEQGDPNTSRVYDRDPVERAKAFANAGAGRLHVVDLDRAFERGDNHATLKAICHSVDIPVQVGGGIRSLELAQTAFAAGAQDIILGTLLVNDEPTSRSIIKRFAGRVIAAIDARGREVATRGWTERAPVSRDILVNRVAHWGVARVIFTEIRRDGMGEGFDIKALNEVAHAADVRVTASGGASSLADLVLLKDSVPPNVDSCVLGSALYKGTMDLRRAIAALAQSTSKPINMR